MFTRVTMFARLRRPDAAQPADEVRLLPQTEARLRCAALTPADIEAIGPFVRVVRFDAETHADACADLALAVRLHHGAYPPPDVASTKDAMTAWLSEGPYLTRVVATIDDKVVGHAALTPAHDYLASRLDRGVAWGEVSKLFADPDQRRHGIGTLLLQAVQSEARRRGLAPALAVLEATPGAIRLYEHLGWTEATWFDGIHGRNRVFTHAPDPYAVYVAHGTPLSSLPEVNPDETGSRR